MQIRQSLTPNPFFLILPIGRDPINTPHIMEKGIFAPKETLLFYTILHDRCKEKKNGKPPLVVDVGTNVGWFTMLSAAMGCRVLSFEPNPSIHPYLKMSIALNNFGDLVELRHSMVSDKQGVSSFILTKNWGYSHRNDGQQDKGEETRVDVTQEALDDLVKEGMSSATLLAS